MPKEPERTAAYFRAEAMRVRGEAERASSERVRRQLLTMAAGYDALAETAGTIERQRRGLRPADQ
jgi:hypothetical protein